MDRETGLFERYGVQTAEEIDLKSAEWEESAKTATNEPRPWFIDEDGLKHVWNKFFKTDQF